jgi:hypothetical protein
MLFPSYVLRRSLRHAALPSLILAAMITGCDSGPDMNDPTVKKQIETRNEIVRKEEDLANKTLQKGKGKMPPMVKSIKGAIGAGQPPAQ